MPRRRSPGSARPEAIARHGIDPARIVVAGHSMGGMMAARAAADDARTAGVVLIEAWDIAGTGRSFADPAAKERFLAGELRGDLPPLSGTSETALVREIKQAPPALDLVAAAPALAIRPLLVLAAERGIGATALAPGEAAKRAGGTAVTEITMPTDHSFSDRRIALETTVLDWLATLPR